MEPTTNKTTGGKGRSLKRLVMQRPVRARMTRHVIHGCGENLSGGEWIESAPDDMNAALIMMIPMEEWKLISREAAILREISKRLDEESMLIKLGRKQVYQIINIVQKREKRELHNKQS